MSYDQTARVMAVSAVIALVTMTGLMAIQRKNPDQLSVAGAWTLSASGPHPINVRLVLEQDATKVTGTLGNPHGGSDFQLTGTFIDRKIALTAAGGTDLELVGELKHDDTLAGTLSSARGDFDWTAKRAAASR